MRSIAPLTWLTDQQSKALGKENHRFWYLSRSNPGIAGVGVPTSALRSEADMRGALGYVR